MVINFLLQPVFAQRIRRGFKQEQVSLLTCMSVSTKKRRHFLPPRNTHLIHLYYLFLFFCFFISGKIACIGYQILSDTFDELLQIPMSSAFLISFSLNAGCAIEIRSSVLSQVVFPLSSTAPYSVTI